jgi:GntR family transcriptional regulator
MGADARRVPAAVKQVIQMTSSGMVFATLPSGTGTLRYRAVKRELLAAIEDGRLPPGAALPSEARLAAAFGIAIGTLRQAVGELVMEHVLLRRQGVGTFVAEHSPERFVFQFFHVERADGLREAPQVELIEFLRATLDEEAAQALQAGAGDPAWIVRNRLLLQGRAVAHDRLLLPLTLFRGLTERHLRGRPGTIYRLWQEAFGITVLRAQERVRAVAAGNEAARALGVARGAPVLEVRRTAFSFSERPVEYRVSTIVTGTHEYVQTLSRP